VRNEYEAGENDPFNVLLERAVATAYLWHNYGKSTIGARSDIENVPIERLQAFYHKYYQPDNAMLVVAGRFDEQAALTLIAQKFGRIPRPRRNGEMRIWPTYTEEPVQDGERSVTLRRVGDVQVVAAVYHVPAGSHEDFAAVAVLAQVLGDEPAGRLYKALVEPKLAASVGNVEFQLREPGALILYAVVRKQDPLDTARAALRRAIDGIVSEPASAAEVERARATLLKNIDLALNNSDQVGLRLSEWAAMGDWRLLFLHRDRIKRVTPADVQRVAVTYLKPSNRTLGTFIPIDKPDRAEIPPVPDLAAALKDYRGSATVAQGEDFNPTPANIEARVIRSTLAGGMKLALLPKKTRGGTVVAQLALRWGDEQSKLNRAAACGVASGMLLRGTQKNSREQLRNQFDRLKANVGVGGDGGSIETVRESLPETLKLMAEVLRQPSFPNEEFEQLRRSSLTSIDTQRSDPGALAGLALARHLNPYPPEHWLYTATLDERSTRLQALSLAEVKRCYADFYGASDSELAVVGDFDPEQIERLAQELFGGWKSPRPYARIPLRVAEVAPVDDVINTPDKANAVLRAGVLLRLRDDNADYPALLLGNYLLGGSSDSRLMRRIREKEGLSYSVGSFLSADSFFERASFGVFAIYAPQNRARVEAALSEELRKALAGGFSAEEVEAGKKGLLQSRQLARSSDATVASRLVSYLVLGRTFAWEEEQERRIAALTPQAVVEALRRHIDPARLSAVKAGDFTSVAANTSGPDRAN